MRVFRVNAVIEGRHVVLGTATTATQALERVRDAISEYRRAWATDEQGIDVSLPDLMRMADEEPPATPRG